MIGHPVSQSVSPEIHAAFARLTAQDISYELLDATPEQFVSAVEKFRADGGKGLNVTLPHKAAACALADDVSQRAKVAGAANTLIFGDNGIAADNTDGVGLVRDLEHHHFALNGLTILIVGAGGACCGLVQPLLEAGVREIIITNRTYARAKEVVGMLKQHFGSAVNAVALEELKSIKCDALINATSASLSGAVPDLEGLALENVKWGYDLVYAKDGNKTVFAQWLTEQGVPAEDGYGMLIEQAAESFYLWRGVRPPTSTLRRDATQ